MTCFDTHTSTSSLFFHRPLAAWLMTSIGRLGCSIAHNHCKIHLHFDSNNCTVVAPLYTIWITSPRSKTTYQLTTNSQALYNLLLYTYTHTSTSSCCSVYYRLRAILCLWTGCTSIQFSFSIMALTCHCTSQGYGKIWGVRGHPVLQDNWLHIKTFRSMHPCSNDDIITGQNRPHTEALQSTPFCHDNGIVTSHNRLHIETLWSAPFCCDNGVVTSHNRPPIKAFQSAGPYIPPHHHPTFSSYVRLHIKAF